MGRRASGRERVRPRTPLVDVGDAERIAGGMHVAFLVAACLSVVAVVGSLFVRTPETGSAPAPH